MHKTYLHFLNGELKEIYRIALIRVFALSLINIFLPVYFWQSGFTLKMIFLFVATANVSHIFSVYLSAKLSSKADLKYLIALSLPLLILSIFFIVTVNKYHWHPVFLGFPSGLQSGLYWISFHCNFAKNTRPQTRGRSLGVFSVLSSAAAIIGPLIGGAVISFLGFCFLFLLMILILFLMFPFLLGPKEAFDGADFSLRRMIRKGSFRNSIVFFAQGFESVGLGYVWPIFMFLILEKYYSLGLAAALAGVAMCGVIFLAGKIADIFKRRKIIRFTAIFTLIFWIIKSLVKTPVQVFAANFLSNANDWVRIISMDSLAYDKATNTDILGFVVMREIMLSLGCLAFCLVFYYVSDLSLILKLTGFAPLGYLLF